MRSFPRIPFRTAICPSRGAEVCSIGVCVTGRPIATALPMRRAVKTDPARLGVQPGTLDFRLNARNLLQARTHQRGVRHHGYPRSSPDPISPDDVHRTEYQHQHTEPEKDSRAMNSLLAREAAP